MIKPTKILSTHEMVIGVEKGKIVGPFLHIRIWRKEYSIEGCYDWPELGGHIKKKSNIGRKEVNGYTIMHQRYLLFTSSVCIMSKGLKLSMVVHATESSLYRRVSNARALQEVSTKDT